MRWILRSPLLAVLVVGLLVLGLERLIVTDAERIEQLGADAAAAIETQAWEWLEQMLHEEFEYQSRDRAETIEHIRSLVRKYKPTEVGIAFLEIKVDGAQATAKCVVRGTAMGRPARIPVDALFKETEDGWKLWKVKGGAYVR